MTAPIIPTDLVYPVRGEDRSVFASKANTFNQRLVDDLTPKLNELGVWSNDTATQVSTDALTATNKAAESSVSADNAALSESNALTYSNNTTSALNAALDIQNQANAILGAGIGTTYLDNGDLYINYVEALVSDITIDSEGRLTVTSI